MLGRIPLTKRYGRKFRKLMTTASCSSFVRSLRMRFSITRNRASHRMTVMIPSGIKDRCGIDEREVPEKD